MSLCAGRSCCHPAYLTGLLLLSICVTPLPVTPPPLISPNFPLILLLSAQGRRFAVQLPHPAAEQAEFVVLRGRYHAAISRCWEVGHQCQVSCFLRRFF